MLSQSAQLNVLRNSMSNHVNPKVKLMNLREELTELKLLEFMVTIDLLIPLGEITALEP